MNRLKGWGKIFASLTIVSLTLLIVGFNFDSPEIATISGRVIFKRFRDYKDKPIVVIAHSKLLEDYSKYVGKMPILRPGEAPSADVDIGGIYLTDEKALYVNFIELSKPKRYSIKVPRILGEIYIMAVNESIEYVKDIKPIDERKTALGYYVGNPLKLSSANIKNINIVMHPPVVTLSGKVIFDGYSGGSIVISAVRATSRGTASAEEISSTIIPGPGDFSINIPKNIGNIYLTAVNIIGEDKNRKPDINDPVGKLESPLKVGTSDIKDIVISIQ